MNKLNITTIGAVVQPAADLVEIVPLEDTLLIEAQIRPKDVAFLHPGQKAQVKITAYDFSVYGGLEGFLERISADTTEDEEGNRFFRVMIRTDKNYLGSDTDPLPIIPGMVASIDILTGEKTVLDYILKPIKRYGTKHSGSADVSTYNEAIGRWNRVQPRRQCRQRTGKLCPKPGKRSYAQLLCKRLVLPRKRKRHCRALTMFRSFFKHPCLIRHVHRQNPPHCISHRFQRHRRQSQSSCRKCELALSPSRRFQHRL